MSQDQRKLENLLNKFYNEIQENKEPRNEAKELIKPAIDFLVGTVTDGDAKYSGTVGIVSRSYRGCGTYGATDFDIQLPLVTPDGAKIVPGQLPNVAVQLEEPSSDWRKFTDRSYISAAALRADLHVQLTKAAGMWNSEHAEESEIDIPQLPTKRAPISVNVTPAGKPRMSLDCTVIISAEGMEGLEDVKEGIKSPQNPARWPEDENVREQIANQILLIPSSDGTNWTISLMIGQKAMVKALGDGGKTCRMQLYKTFKMINKYAWCGSPNDNEMVKLGNHCIQNVYFHQVSKFPEKEYWKPEKIVRCFNDTLREIRYKFANAEVTEYMVPGSPSVIAGYKQPTGYLDPKLAATVRRMEATQSNTIKVLENLVKKFKSDGKLTLR